MSLHPRILIASAVLVVLLTGGAMAGAALPCHFYDGVSDPPPTFPSPGRGIAVDDAQWATQSFQAGGSYSLTRVALWAQYAGNASEPTTLEVRRGSGGLPDMSAPPLASDTEIGSPTFGWVNFTFGSATSVVGGQMYWVVLRNASGTSSSGWNWWNTRADTYLNPGQGLASTDGGATWNAGSLGDFALRAFGYVDTTVTVAAGANKAEAAGGDTVRFSIWFNNTGTEAALHVWINATLPSGLSFASDNASTIGGIRTAGRTEWTFTAVGPGSHFYFVTASVNGGGADTFLNAEFRLAYDDFLGAARPGSIATSSILFTGATPSSETFDLGALLAIVAAGAALALAFVLWRRGGRIEEVFLVHWSGVLIVHLSKTIKSATDRDILAGMLTTIQQFAREAFVEWKGRDIRRIDLGNQKIFLTRGSYSFLAVVVRGRKPAGLAARSERTVAGFEEIYEGQLEEWDGALETLGGAEEILADAMFEGEFVRFSRWVLHRLRPRSSPLPSSFPGLANDRRRARLSKQAGLRRLALRFAQRRELDQLDENDRSYVETALEEIATGRFTICGFANVYVAMMHRDASSPKTDAWWDAILQLTRDVLRLWRWDPETQAWVSERDEGTPAVRPSPSGRGLDARPTDRAEPRVLVAAVPSLDTARRSEEG